MIEKNLVTTHRDMITGKEVVDYFEKTYGVTYTERYINRILKVDFEKARPSSKLILTVANRIIKEKAKAALAAA